MLETLLLYLLLGSFAGLLAGLLGVGGGLVIVPVLAFAFTRQAINPELIMHLALGTSLASIVVTGLSSAWSHHRLGAVEWPVVGRLVPGLLIGALLGAVLADQLSGRHLRGFFGVFEIGVGLYMILGAPVAHGRGERSVGSFELASVGSGIGLISALLGIGGGTLTVPYLSWCGRSVRNAVAVSAACGVPIALSGALGYLWTGQDAVSLPALSVGYIYLPALFGLVAASLFTAPLGARLAHRLPVKVLKRLFGGLLLAIGASMIV